MVKHKLMCAFLATSTILGSGVLAPMGAWADEMPSSCDGLENCAVITSTDELSTAVTAKNTTLIVGADFDLTADIRLNKGVDTTLYLGDYTITSDGWSFINAAENDLVIYGGTEGKIEETGGTYAPFYAYGNLVLNSGTIETAGLTVYAIGETGVFTMNGGSIVGGETAVTINDGASFVLNNGTVSATSWGVTVFNDSEIVMNGGTITAGSIGVSGNGTTSETATNYGANAKLTLNAGTIESESLGVYAPQKNGTTVLGEGLTIDAKSTGVEVRAGSLTINGATINVDESTEYTAFEPNGSGSTATGVGVAVSQHTTELPIAVTINSGNITAPVAFAEANPQKNAEESIEEVTLSIAGGTFVATNGDPIVASEDKTGFITGGSYSKSLDETFVADGYKLVYEGGLFNVVSAAELESEGNETEVEVVNGEEVNVVYPKVVDLNGVQKTAEVDGRKVAATFGSTLSADRKATLAVEAKEDISEYAVTSGDLKFAFDISLEDRNGDEIGVDSNSVEVVLYLTEEEYNELAAHDKIQVVYFDESGNEAERLDATLVAENGEYMLKFTTTHFSTYGVVTVDETAATPETGTMTAAGASARGAALVTSVVVGLLTSVASFIYLRRRW